MRLRTLRREVREGIPRLASRVASPKRLEAVTAGATRTSQVMALLFLPVVIVVSFALLQAFNNLMGDVFTGGGWTSTDPQTGLFAWLITFITLGALVVVAWAWFQFVKTGGFGMFKVD